MNQETDKAAPAPEPRRRRGWHRLRRWFVGTLLMLCALVLLLQLPVVQNWIAQRVTASLEKTLETRVTVDNVRISWLDEMTIEGLFVADKYGDTLLYGGNLNADFDLFGGLVIESVKISDTNFKIRRDLGDPESNLETALQKLFPPKPGRTANPLNLKLNRLELERIRFVQNDSVRGQRIDVSLASAVARIQDLDLPGNVVRISEAEVREPVVRQTSIPPNPLDSLLIRVDKRVVDTTRSALRILANSIEIIDGVYELDNLRKAPIERSDISAVDFARLGIRNIDLELTEVDVLGGELAAKLKHLSLEERSGFVLDRLSVQDLKITGTELQLYDLELVTAESSLSDSLRFSFPGGWSAWSDFNDRVRMDIRVKDSDVAVRDILYFARKLRFNPFFRENRGEKIQIAGNFKGRVNNLKGDEIALALDRTTRLRGEFNSRNIARPGSEFLYLNLGRLDTRMTTLRRLLPGFTPPENFNSLGNLSFSGIFNGFFSDFAAEGELASEIGRAGFDMKLITADGPRPATYEGKINLNDFDLGAWSGNPEFGLVSMSGTVNNGIGLRAATAQADLDAVVQRFVFRDYAYENARIDGRLEERFFDGNLAIRDDNIDFSFAGQIDFRDSLPTYDFDATVGELDLLALNLSQRPVALHGNIDLNLIGKNFREMEGRVALDSFQVLIDTLLVDIDSLLAYSNFNEQGQKVVRLESDLAEAELVGRFDLDEVTTSFTGFLHKYYPGWASRLRVAPPRRLPDPNRFSFDIKVLDSRGLNRLIAPTLGPLRNLELKGGYDGFVDTFKLDLTAPQLVLGNVELIDFILKAGSKRNEGDLDFAVDSTIINGKPLLNRITLLSLVDDGLIDFGLTYGGDEQNVLLDRVNLDGELRLRDSLNFELSFEESQLELFRRSWNVRAGNRIVFGPQYVDAQNFVLSSGRRAIRLNNYGADGLNLDLLNMNLGLIDSVWAYPQLDFSGEVDVNVTVADVFNMKGIKAQFRSDTFLMNNEDYGYLRIDASAPDLKHKLTAYLNLNRDTAQLIAEATYNLGDLVAADPTPAQRRGYLDLDVAINGYPTELAKYWVGGSVSDITGQFDARLEVAGPTDRLDVSGYIAAQAGAFTIDYLQTRYRYYQSQVNINNSLFDITGTRLIDRFGNGAVLSGGITHDRLKNLGLDARITTDRFLALDLAPGQNPNFYGRAIGSGFVSFSGDFKQTDIYVRANVGSESKLSIPVDYGQQAGPIDNVRFVDRSVYVREDEEEVAEEPTGVSLEMELTVTDQAVGEIIFDEEVGDVLRGQGNGNLRLVIPRDGDLRMFGTYTISEGSYLFTFYDVINKEFSVRPGGTVVWTGDPFEAQIDIAADYENLKAPIYNFIQEYLVTDATNSLSSDAARATDIDLSLQLAGILTKPDINFDIGFPNLTGQLESYAENKRRLLLLDQNELNRQVFGLIVAGQFLPSDLSIGLGDVVVNTVSEWLSNYFSLLLNNLVKNAFGEESSISKFDFDVAYNNYRNANPDPTQTAGRGEAFEFTVSRDFTERFSFQADINVLNDQVFTQGTFVGNNLVLEYILNNSRTLKVRVYERIEPDIAARSRLQVGTGLTWRREFDTFEEFFRGLRKDAGE